ncbi:GNAT family N-acetyltransferase [Nocardia sp. NPDC024068]|uniref:GNAT family N-acetyltransferase n=1 Tax=Nocardia sp. NPDC024068 TaxID=3157197 RepID=UPI0033E8ECC6
MAESFEVRPAQRADIDALARTLGAAFQEDPVMSWVVPDPRRRAAGAPRFFATQTRHQHFAHGGVDIAVDRSGRIGGAALWDPPGNWRPSPRSELRMFPQMVRAFGTRLLVGKRLADTMSGVHPDEPHWYLAVLGTDPSVRGAGYGQALLRSRLDRCDRDGVPAYLESSNKSNVPYYERFGFEVTATISVPDGGPDLWAMWRPPVPPG